MKIRVDNNQNPILEQFSEDGFIDCTFKIKDLKETADHFLMHLVASHNDEKVGMDVEIVKGIKSGFDSKMNLINDHVYRKGVVFSRSGPESDRLVSALSKLYGYKKSNLKMVEKETFTGIALHQGELNMKTELVKIKIFGKDSDNDLENNYYESFLNLDLKNGLVFWNEKDQEYRDPLIRGLSQN